MLGHHEPIDSPSSIVEFLSVKSQELMRTGQNLVRAFTGSQQDSPDW